VRYKTEFLVGFCYPCSAMHSTEEATRTLENKRTHCEHCHQLLPEQQRLSGQAVWRCNRTEAEIRDVFTPLLKVEVPFDEYGMPQLLEVQE
jgi:phage terminase large subunit GpA-like protein